MDKRAFYSHLVLLVGLAVLGGPASASFRCGSSLVAVGAWPVEVEERCGQPDYVATYPSAAIAGIGVVEDIEHWYYNRGPRKFIRRLEFRNGKLHREDTLGYGFTGSSPGPCTPAAIDVGTSEYEVVARCGEPLSSRVEWQAPHGRYGDGRIATQLVVPVQEWLYEFSGQQFRRVVVLRNGRVIRMEQADKPR